MQTSSRNAAMLISSMVVSAFIVLIKGALGVHPMHHFQFLSLLLLALLTSRLKVKLPGLTGNMSVNLPFLFLAIVQLSLLEVALIAFASTLVQSLPKAGKPLKLFQVLFNASTVTTAAGFAYLVFRNSAWLRDANVSLSLVLASGTFFFFNTVPVATIISLTEGAKLVRTWLSILHLSFPYYVAGAGITSIVAGRGGYVSWALPLGVLPVMLLMYRSFRTYFGEELMMASTASTSAHGFRPLTRQKGARAS
jgi:hypothetical protein